MMDNLKLALEKKLGIPSIKFFRNNPSELLLTTSEEEFEKIITVLAEKGFNLLSAFATEKVNHKGFALWYVFEKKDYADFLILQRDTFKNATSIAGYFPSASWYEREMRDGFGIDFVNSYDQRRLFLHESYPQEFHPLQKSFQNSPVKLKKIILPNEEYQFKPVHGEGVYHIPVGPVHAGIIEPGHFRFSVIGETIFNLEIRLFWKHRGIEKIAEGKKPKEALAFAESISGDETVANAWAYCSAVEKINQVKVPDRAEHLRLLFAEMERIYALLGDLAGMVVDVAYPAGASNFFIFREEILRWNEKLCGSRFFKDSFCIGGVKHNPEQKVLTELSVHLSKFAARLKSASKQTIAFPPVLDRFESTGIVAKEIVQPLNLSGPLARASGTAADVRLDHPYGLYNKITPSSTVLPQGDVLARFRVKAATILDSVNLILKNIKEMPSGEISVDQNQKDGYAISVTESARGQTFHFVHVRNGKIERYKVRTASFCNWQAMEHAILGNIVPDFPLINKSMNLSYAGNDL